MIARLRDLAFPALLGFSLVFGLGWVGLWVLLP